MITFACFHMEIHKTDLAHIPRQWHAIVEKEDRHTYLDACLSSCRVLHSGCRTVVLTDTDTSFPAARPYEVFRCTGLDSTRLMFSRSQAWMRFLETVDTHVVLLDSDILLQQSLDPLFATRFDAGLTYRQEVEWPINAGIQFFHRARRERGAAFLRACLDLFETRYAGAAAWGGDQDVLRDLTAGADYGRKDVYRWQTQSGFELLMLPCAQYNFSTQAPPMRGPYPGVPVLHFKGSRKDDMLAYWAQYLDPARGALLPPRSP